VSGHPGHPPGTAPDYGESSANHFKAIYIAHMAKSPGKFGSIVQRA